MDHIKKIAPVLLSVMLGLFALLSLRLAWTESTTMDEKAHIPSAYSYVRYGDMRLNPEHPPLLKDLAGLPLLVIDLTFPTDSWQWREGINEQWTLGDIFIFRSGNDAELITFWSRVPIILVSLLLALFVYRWTKELAGTVAALFAVLLYVSDPNIIGHGHFVTTDIGIAAFIFIAFYYFVRFLRDPSWANLALAGVALGLAELAKFSAVLLFPYFALIGLAYAVTRPGREGRSCLSSAFGNAVEFVWKYAIIVAICFAVIYALYLPNTMNMPAEKLGEIATAVFPGDKTAGRFAIDTVTAMSTLSGMKPLAEYFLGVFMVFMRVAGGNTYYFLGTVTNHATPWYFPVVFALKETLPFLFLLLSTSLYALVRIVRSVAGKPAASLWGIFAHSFQSHIAQYTMFGFILLYAYISITGNLNIGFRHLFPILPLFYVLIAKTVFDYIRRQDFAGERASRTVLFGIVLWIAAIPVLAYPSYLSYFNASVGGSEYGYRYVTDSNYDWGQDVKRLRDWVDAYDECVTSMPGTSECQALLGIHPPLTSAALPFPTTTPIDQIKVDYFGGTDPRYYLGDRYIEWHSDYGPAPGWYAISIGFYMESVHRTDLDPAKTYRWLEGYDPIARVGDSILIFYIPPQSEGWAAEHGTCTE